MLEFSKYNHVAGIYKLQNKINHKCYIGQSVDLGCRLRHHLNNHKHHRYNTPLYKAFDKYGVDSFDLEILFYIVNPTGDIKSLLDRLEIAYIEKYNSYGKTGYNQTRGGDAGILGYKFTDEQRKKVSKANKENLKRLCMKHYIYNIVTKDIYEFNSFQDCALFLNCTHSQVSRLCHWKQLTLNKVWVGSLQKDKLLERAEFVKNYKRNVVYTKQTRKRPQPGLKRHFNTASGKKIISEEQKKKISEGLKRYYSTLRKQ